MIPMHPQVVQLNISYDGTRFFGWQKTKTGPSIQAELESALSRILGHPLATEAASRTDRGVHARGQIVHFSIDQEIDPRRLVRGLNAILPPDIRVNSASLASPSFHATLDALSKEYRYMICNGPVQSPIHRLYSWHIHLPLDISAMAKAASDLIGTHDFSAFSNERTEDATRTMESIFIEPFCDRLCIRLHGNRFLYKMARNIAGTLAAIGSGKLPPDSIPAILDSKDRKRAGPTAPAHGLFLMQIFYP